MGRHPLPSNVHELKGSYKKDPQRRRLREPKGKGEIGALGRAKTIKGCAEELKRILPEGVLTGSDAPMLEIAARLLSEYRREGDLASGKISQLVSVLARLGGSPADRARLELPGDEREDEWNV